MRPYSAVSWVTSSLACAGGGGGGGAAREEGVEFRDRCAVKCDWPCSASAFTSSPSLTHKHPVSVFVENRKMIMGFLLFRLPQGD